ncbi:MAG: tRNA uridine-5-carboxymethylaminomethyl(34) synthesis GTPase MnmE [Acidobacteriota bacterium]|nr:tRNA uridine-5-carboxymethylaminomethyl(34) synthesis GTPase MnmE [Acidobacteriota bacterium]
MFDTDDTIVAIATPRGRGGIGVVRLSGPGAARVTAAMRPGLPGLEPRHATLTRLTDAGANPIDEVVATSFPAPHSYTGQHVIELSAHGNPVVLDRIVGAAVAAGARMAEPGEFTLRAFLHGKIDLSQAEAVADLVDAVTPVQARSAFDQLEGTLTRVIGGIDTALFELIVRLEASVDFPEEGYHFVTPAQAATEAGAIAGAIAALLARGRQGRLIREGAQVVLAGRPNTGKSSLFNTLAGADRAIVTDVPGTTRDLVTDVIDLDGLAVTLVDTAGLRSTTDLVESEGVGRAEQAARVAACVVVVLDGSAALDAGDQQLLQALEAPTRVVALNKCDLPEAFDMSALDLAGSIPCLRVSARTGAGVAALREAIATALSGRDPLRDAPAVTNQRHLTLLARAHEAIARGADALEQGAPEELALADLQDARGALDEIVGKRTADDILRKIFESFCIGK